MAGGVDTRPQPHHKGWDHEQFAVYVWRSVRKTGDTKTVKSRRSLLLPERCVEVLRQLKAEQDRAHDAAGNAWRGELVFCTRTGTRSAPKT
jgi:hypothetical protein